MSKIPNAHDFFNLASKQPNNKASSRSYNKAALLYLKMNDYDRSGLSYELSADKLLEYDNRYLAAENYIKSSEQYMRVDVDKAISVLSKAADIYVKGRYFRLAAKNYESLGNINNKHNRYLEAIDAYEKAHKHYTNSDMKNNSINCLRLLSDMMIKNEDYGKALLVLEKIYIKIPSVKIFFDIGIIRLHINGVEDTYLKSKTHHLLTRENIFLNDLIVLIKKKNLIGCRRLIMDQNSLSGLNKWQYNLLMDMINNI